MPTKKKRIGFIPSSDVLKIIDDISVEHNYSNSKVVNVLIEEALNARGFIINRENDFYDKDYKHFRKEIIDLEKKLRVKDIEYINENEDISISRNNKKMYKLFILFLHFKKMFNMFEKLDDFK